MHPGARPSPARGARRARPGVLLFVLAVAGCTGGTRADGPTTAETGPRPAARAAAEAPPGTLVDATPVDAPPGAHAWRIVYHSTDATGADITVTGLVIAPDGAQSGDRPVVSWGHSTTGTADHCAPSTRDVTEVPVTTEALAQGWVVVAADFEGLGAEGPHPYLVGTSAGHTMLDVVRAAGQLEDSGVAAASPVALWGFSQGGQAALFAAEDAATYAPELDIRGVAAVAPVADTRQFWDRAVERTDQVGVAVAMVHGLAAADPELVIADVLTDHAVEQLDLLESECIGEVVEAFAGPVDDVVRGPVDEHADWAEALDANTAGRRPFAMPTLLMQGDDDDIVYPVIGDELADRLCAHGDPVDYVKVPGAGHGDIPPEAVTTWLTARFEGTAAPTSCP